jgi:perosamine synthetase
MSQPLLPLVKVGMPDPERLMPQLQSMLYSGMIGEGEAVYAFEDAFASHFGLPNALGMSSGTAALHACLTLAGVGPGDEVISTAMTAEPTNIVILQTGAQVVWADVDPACGNISADSVRDRITDRTKAIMVVHYAGYPVDMAAIRAVAGSIPVIEDCAHALGARAADAPVGTVGDYGIFSLQAIKHMTTVDGGVFTTRHVDQLPAARRFRWFGLEKGKPRTEIDIRELGYKYNMNNVTATIGLAQLEVIQNRLDRHIANGQFLDEALAKIPGLAPAKTYAQGQSSYWLYTLLCDRSSDVEQALIRQGISASKLHKRNDEHSVFAASRTQLPGLTEFYDRLMHIPCGWWVTDQDCEHIVEILSKG